jgi:hypothetical protein
MFAEALEREADLSAFRRWPSARLASGLALVGLSYVVGWPAMAVWATVCLWMHRPKLAVIGPPLLYGLSWAIWAVGIWLAGPESLGHLRTLKHLALRRFALRFLVRC